MSLNCLSAFVSLSTCEEAERIANYHTEVSIAFRLLSHFRLSQQIIHYFLGFVGCFEGSLKGGGFLRCLQELSPSLTNAEQILSVG